MWRSHSSYKERGLGRRLYNQMHGNVIIFLHFLIHTAWWWLFYAAETCSCFGIALIKVVYRRITSLRRCITGMSLKAARMTNTKPIACQNIRVREIHSAASYLRSTVYENLENCEYIQKSSKTYTPKQSQRSVNGANELKYFTELTRTRDWKPA